MTGRINQMGLISAIATELDRQGFRKGTVEQLNAIIDAANVVVAAYSETEKPADRGKGGEA